MKKNTALHADHRKQPTTQSQQSEAVQHVESCHMARVDTYRSSFMAKTTFGQSPATETAFLRLALQNPHYLPTFRCSLKDENNFSIIWDSGASICITHDTNDFVGELESPGTMTYLKGVSPKGLQTAGKGQVLWTILDTQGQLRVLKVAVYYVPKSCACLLSTSALLQT
jgi:hypothetical protein